MEKGEDWDKKIEKEGQHTYNLIPQSAIGGL